MNWTFMPDKRGVDVIGTIRTIRRFIRWINVKRAMYLLIPVGLIALLLTASAIAARCSSSSDDQAGPDSTATSTTTPNANAFVTGTVTHPDSSALIPGTVLTVELRDTTLQDASSKLIASQTITIQQGQEFPISFQIGYNKDEINPRNIYTISARITDLNSDLILTNDTSYEVITRGNPTNVDMEIVSVLDDLPASV